VICCELIPSALGLSKDILRFYIAKQTRYTDRF
jgi:hypothetical protein